MTQVQARNSDHGQKAHRRICIEIRWCPSHQGIEGNEIDAVAHGVEWLDFKDPHGIVGKRRFSLPRSFANFKRDFSE